MNYRPFEDCDELIWCWRKIWRKARRFHEEYDFDPTIEMPTIWVVNKYTGVREMIVGYGKKVVLLPTSDHSMQGLLDNYTFIDGSPCGVLI